MKRLGRTCISTSYYWKENKSPEIRIQKYIPLNNLFVNNQIIKTHDRTSKLVVELSQQVD